MFGTPFYHSRTRKSVALFGSLFNNIYLIRKNSLDQVVSTIRVPLAYAPKEKYLERLKENPDLEADTKVAMKLPRMSFEILSFAYDSTRQTSKMNRFSSTSSASGGKNLFYSGVPYNMYFQLSIYARTHDDALQIVEQIIPYFSPAYTLTIKPFEDYPSVKEDVPITLVSTSFSDDYEGMLETRRTIIYTLEFEMKTMFYGPVSDDSSLIRKAITNFYLIGDSDTPVSTLVTDPDPIDVSADSDYGFTETWTDHIE